MRHSFLSKLLGKFERVGPREIQGVFLSLVKEKGFLEAIFNALQEGIIVLDNLGKIKYSNLAVQRLFGVSPEDIHGKEIQKCIPLIDWPELISLGKVISRDFQVFYPEPRYFNLSLIPLEGLGDKNAAYIAIFYDITATREKTLEAIESEKLNLLTMLAAGVAHELGNPINALGIHFQLIEKRYKKLLQQKNGQIGDKEIENSFAAIRSEIRRLDGIINQFLKAIRPSPPKLRLLSLNQVLKQAVEFLSPEIQNLDILIEMDLDQGLPLLRADRNQLKQAFYNILKNGIEAVGKNGIIKISTHADDSFLIVAFQDNGTGIAQEAMSHLFKPYFTTKSSGTGLGLLIVRRIIRDHGGEVQIESQKGKGTTVKILLPRAERLIRLLPMAEKAKQAEARCDE